MDKLIENTQTAFNNTILNNSEETLNKVTEKIVSSKRIEIYGIYQSGIVANNLYYKLLHLFEKKCHQTKILFLHKHILLHFLLIANVLYEEAKIAISYYLLLQSSLYITPCFCFFLNYICLKKAKCDCVLRFSLFFCEKLKFLVAKGRE